MLSDDELERRNEEALRSREEEDFSRGDPRYASDEDEDDDEEHD